MEHQLPYSGKELRKEDEKVKYCGSTSSSITNSVIDHNAYDMDSETNITLTFQNWKVVLLHIINTSKLESCSLSNIFYKTSMLMNTSKLNFVTKMNIVYLKK